nr:putative integron gene cassette protein [uncultured bacterium]
MTRLLDATWEKELLAASARLSQAQEENFLDLVDAAEGRIDETIARVLLRTFSAKDDYGTQERVVSVLSTGADQVVIDAIVEEMPRLALEAPEWAQTLLGTEVEFRPDLTARALSQAPTICRIAAENILKNEDFQSQYPNAALVLGQLDA